MKYKELKLKYNELKKIENDSYKIGFNKESFELVDRLLGNLLNHIKNTEEDHERIGVIDEARKKYCATVKLLDKVKAQIKRLYNNNNRKIEKLKKELAELEQEQRELKNDNDNEWYWNEVKN
jgi:gas vesicle protein